MTEPAHPFPVGSRVVYRDLLDPGAAPLHGQVVEADAARVSVRYDGRPEGSPLGVIGQSCWHLLAVEADAERYFTPTRRAQLAAAERDRMPQLGQVDQ